MSLSKVFAALTAVPDQGEELSNFLKSHLAEKNRVATELESQLNTAHDSIKTIARTLGVGEAETLATLQSTITALKGKETEVSSLKETTFTKDSEINQLKLQVEGLQRRENLIEFCGVVGADREVVLDLLPSELELKIEEATANGKPVKQGFVVVEGKNTPFADFVNSDPKLAKFAASIFPQFSNPPRIPPKLPTGKSEAARITVADSLKDTQKARAAKLREQLNG